MSDHIRIVEMTDEHVNYIRKSFCRDYSRAHGISPALASSKLEPLLGAWDCWVAEADGVSGEILGWFLARDKHMLGWLHVKHVFRHHGVAGRLLSHVGISGGSIDTAFYTPTAAKWCEQYGIALRWRPYEPDKEALYWQNIVESASVTLAASNAAEGE